MRALFRPRPALPVSRRARNRGRPAGSARVIPLWFALLTFTLILFVVLDGWNIGAGVVQPFLARTGDDQRRVVAALGPLWSWHEVWLVAAGGVFILAFPRVMAAGFA